MWHSETASMSETYADELMEGVDVADHLDGGFGAEGQMRGRLPVTMHAWIILVGSLAVLWFIGGVLFKGVNI